MKLGMEIILLGVLAIAKDSCRGAESVAFFHLRIFNTYKLVNITYIVMAFFIISVRSVVTSGPCEDA
jgi:hypothetical protein